MRRNYRTLEIICENLSVLYGDGISINESIILLKELDLGKKYKESLSKIEKSILKGNSLADSFSLFPKLYPPLFITFISIGEKNGKLSKVLNNLSRYYKKRKDISNNLISSLSYPIFLFGLMFVAALVVILFIIPSIYNTMKSTSANVSGIVKSINSLSVYIKEKPFISVVYFIGYFVALPIVVGINIRLRVDIRKYIMKLQIVKVYYENLLVLILSIIFESGVNISLGIEYCYENCEEVVIKSELKRIKIELMEGKEISSILSESNFISKSSIAMMRVGEKGGSMSIVLSKLEDRSSKEFNKKIRGVLKKIQPALILFITLCISIFIYVVVLPMFNMMYM